MSVIQHVTIGSSLSVRSFTWLDFAPLVPDFSNIGPFLPLQSFYQLAPATFLVGFAQVGFLLLVLDATTFESLVSMQSLACSESATFVLTLAHLEPSIFLHSSAKADFAALAVGIA